MTFLITDAELAQMQADLAAVAYSDQADVWRPMPPDARRDPAGGARVAPPPTLIATVPCRLTRGFIPAREQSVGGALTDVTTAIVTTAPPDLDPRADIRPSDRLTVTSIAHPEWEPITLEVVRAEVRRSVPLEQVVTCTAVGTLPGATVVPLFT